MTKKQQDTFTKIEILGQPALWSSMYQLLNNKKDEIFYFLEPIFKEKNLQILLTGAGSSAFIGEAAQGLIQKRLGLNTRAIATTDIVTHPRLFLRPNLPLLMISFARSGNSPESLESIRLANTYCKKVYHMIISCNKNGQLAHYAKENPEKSHLLLLPEAANDKSLAMTGSFTSMLLSLLLISDINNLSNRSSDVKEIVHQGNLLLERSTDFHKIAAKDFQRVVFLGSGPMLGIARECHLKLQELTDGRVICKYDSFLGFRHGPRAVINEKTLLVYLFSPDELVYKYELDLAMSITKDPRKVQCLSIGRPERKELNPFLNIDLELKPNQELNIIPAVLVGQLLGYYMSLEKGLNPDNPSVTGAISRVVEGVRIYPSKR